MIQETLTVGALPPVRVQLLGDVHNVVPLASHDAVKTFDPGCLEAVAVSVGHSPRGTLVLAG
jgi:hypothetical protein